MKTKIAVVLLTMGLTTSLCRAERPENELPMYGGQHDPNMEQNKEFSADAAKLGWQYYYQGDLDTAIKRFNQAWMFDRESVDAYWGFGLIMGSRAATDDPEQSLKESVRFLEMANKRAPTNARIIVDLAFSHTVLGHYYTESNRPEAKAEYDKARPLFEAAERLDPKYPLLYSNWSVLDFYTGDYTNAEERLDKAKNLGFTPDPSYAKDLEDKLKQ